MTSQEARHSIESELQAHALDVLLNSLATARVRIFELETELSKLKAPAAPPSDAIPFPAQAVASAAAAPS